MADIRDWEKFKRGRWDWTRLGYEAGFPRGIQFTDLDATIEMNGHFLFIETKHHEGEGEIPALQTGQRLYLERLAINPRHLVLVVYGDAAANHVWAVTRFRWRDGMKQVDRYTFRESPETDGPAFLRRAFAAFAQWAEGSAAS